MEISYLEWNDILAQYYFHEDKAGLEVIIYANKETIDRIGSKRGSNFIDFKKVLIEGPPWVKGAVGFCDKAYYCFANWRKASKFKYPPYIAYLVFFVHVATVGGDFDSKAYYPRLRSELGEQRESGMYPHFDKIDALWEDLQLWTERDMDESLGRFTLRRRFESWTHVGIPLSQILLSDDEREKLPQFFYYSGLDPSDLPSDGVILQKLKLNGGPLFQKRTIDMLNKKNEHLEFQNALVDLVISELLGWDGKYEELIEGQHNQILSKEAPRSALLGFNIDEFAGTILFNLRVKSKKEFPDTPLAYTIHGDQVSCTGSELPYWSRPLKIEKKGALKVFNPVDLDWENGEVFEGMDENPPIRFRASTVRIFLPGRYEGIPGWIETQRVRVKSEYYILCHGVHSSKISAWGPGSNGEFHLVNIKGLPAGWSMFYAKNIQESHPEIGILSLPKQSRFFLDGGLKIGKSNHYLKIAPPHIILDSVAGEENINISYTQTPVPPVPGNPGKFLFPGNLPVDIPIIIELSGKEGKSIQKKTIFLKKLGSPVPGKPIIRDNAGGIPDENFLLRMEKSPVNDYLVNGVSVKKLGEILDTDCMKIITQKFKG